jgi:uncharacterized protein with HEPN domain
MNRRSTEARLEDIYKALGIIYDVRRLLLKYPYEELLPDVAYSATINNLIIIGEAIKHIDRDFKEAHSEINWSEMVGLRNELAHQYFNVTADYLDALIDEHLRDFVEAITKLMAK